MSATLNVPEAGTVSTPPTSVQDFLSFTKLGNTHHNHGLGLFTELEVSIPNRLPALRAHTKQILRIITRT